MDAVSQDSEEGFMSAWKHETVWVEGWESPAMCRGAAALLETTCSSPAPSLASVRRNRGCARSGGRSTCCSAAAIREEVSPPPAPSFARELSVASGFSLRVTLGS
ncbi:hypothetical protein CBR_g4212 [Chara braunii]|uniref:Uncharacterized protein n=1 Tax=Chara braunii TaxID=69332 RepID=A0A388JR03_CHABU|nr:hypothetical protein CBR_g4212 [Chara braunii]|eukprot:GBG60259.1 hypothetical protein CBR_g4212 [Chara braunii]